MRQPTENELHAIIRLSSNDDFKRVIAWFRDSLTHQREVTEATQGEARTESCGASKKIVEQLYYMADAKSAILAIRQARLTENDHQGIE
jgi:hypothetical protein